MRHFSRFTLALFLAVYGLAFARAAEPVQPIVVGYVFPQNGALQPGQIDPRAMTRINYAFAAIRDGRMVLVSEGDKANLRVLTDLKKQNPALTVLISVGGWSGSGGFSDAALTAQSRRVFIDSAIEMVQQCDLDGVDVDWEYPGQPGAGNRFRPEDKQNFTLLLKELRERLTHESAAMHRRLYLTIAAGADDDYITHTEMAKVARSVDTVNLMSYDYYEPGSDAKTGNHAPLFTDPADPKKDSADTSVHDFEAAGVPAAKIVLGVPFYGHVWRQVADVQHGLFQPGKAGPNGYIAYSAIKDTMLGHGYTRYWDAPSSVPYLYSEDQQVFVSYEDPESLAAKCSYVLSHKLGGVMFWSYVNDAGGELLGAIDRGLHEAGSAQTAGK
jgi:chitinase